MKKVNYNFLSLGLFLLFALVATWTIRDYGMGWDEVFRWESGDRKLEYYERLLSSDDPVDVIRNTGSDSYPGLFDVSLAWAHKHTGIDRFLLGHVWSVLFGLAGFLALWLSAWKLGGSRLAFWAVLFLLLVPPFYGHLFHNPKDIPFAAMYMAGLCGLIWAVHDLPRLRWRHVLIAGVCCGLAMAVRIAGMVLLCYLAAVIAVFLLRSYISREWIFMDKDSLPNPDSAVPAGGKLKALGMLALGFAAVPVIAFATLLPWWPSAHKNILAVSGETLQRLHGSAAGIPLFFRGEIIDSSETPFYYAVWMFTIKSPESLLVLLAIGILASIWWVRTHGRDFLRRFPLPWLLPMLGGIFPLIYLTATSPALHDGVRHFLFVYPPIALIAAAIWIHLQDALAARRRELAIAFRVLIGGLLLFQTVHLIALHPYQYVYYNQLIGGPSGAYGHHHTEYWVTSNTHALRWLDQHLQTRDSSLAKGEKVKILITGPWHSARPFLGDRMELTDREDEADFIVANTDMMIHTVFSGEVIHVIGRMGLPICVIMQTAGPGAEPAPGAIAPAPIDGALDRGL